MNVNPLKSPSERLSESSTSSSSGESLDEFHRGLLQVDAIDEIRTVQVTSLLTSKGKNTCRSKEKLRLFRQLRLVV